MKNIFFKYLITCLVILIGAQNSFAAESFKEVDWWGIKCSELPRSFGYSIDKETILISLPDGITGCDKLAVKATVVHIQTSVDCLDNIANHKGLEVWAREYYINNVSYEPHQFVKFFDYSILGSPIFIVNDQSYSIHQALVAYYQKFLSNRPENISNQLGRLESNAFKFTPEINIISQFTNFLELVKRHFTQNIFSDSQGVLVEPAEGKFHLWKMSEPLEIQLMNATSSFQLIGCRKCDWSYFTNPTTVEDFKKLFKEFLGGFNNFNKTLIESTDECHGCHTISYDEKWIQKGSVVPINHGNSVLFVAKNPRTDDQIDLLSNFLQKENQSNIDTIIEELANKKEILNVLAIKVEPFSNYPKLRHDGFGISIGFTKDFAKARSYSSFTESNKRMIRLDFFTNPTQNEKGGIPIDDF